MRVEVNVPTATSNNAQEKVPEKSSGSDFNKVLKSSVNSKNNNSSGNDLKKSSTYSSENKLSDDAKLSKSNAKSVDDDSTNNQLEKCKNISGDNGEKNNISTSEIKKNIDFNEKINNKLKSSKDAIVDNKYIIIEDLPKSKETKDTKANNDLASTVEKVIDKIKEKSDKLDINSIISVINEITAIINNKAENIKDSELNDNLLGEINSILDNKICESNDSLLSFFQTIDSANNSMEDVLENLNAVLSNDDIKISQDDKNGILSILESLETKINENVSVDSNTEKILDGNIAKNSNALLNQEIKTVNKTEANDLNDSSTVISDNKQVLENVQTTQENKGSEVLDTNKELISQIKELLNENKEVSNNNNTQNIIKESAIKIEDNTEIPNNTSSNSDNADDLSGNNKDEQILKSILNDKDTSNTINRATAFAGTFNNVNALDGASEASKFVKAEHLAEDILETVKYMETNNIKELTVKINPRNLGELSIRILQEDGILKAQIKASTKDGYDILSRNVSIINKELSNQNIKIQNVNISLNDDTTFFKGSNFESNANHSNNNETQSSSNTKNINGAAIEDEELDDNDSEILNNINMLA